MNKVRFSCPRCQTVMQTNEDKIGYDIACPHCAYRFKLVEPAPGQAPGSTVGSAPTSGGSVPTIQLEQTMPPGTSPGSSGNNISKPAPVQKPHPAPGTPLPAHGSNNPYLPVVQSNQPYGNHQHGNQVHGRFQCPYCQTLAPPKMQSEINTVGWVVFGVLLVTTCIFCWVGFLIKDRFRVCSQCGIRL